MFLIVGLIIKPCKGFSLISQLLKLIMKKCDLKQKDLVEVLEVSLSRVKAMTSGRVKNFTREEIELLVGKLGIRAEWLITGEGSMFQDDEPQEDLVDRMRSINHARAMVDALPLGDQEKLRLKAVMTGDAKVDGEAIANEMAKTLVQTYPVSGATLLSARESALIDNYRASPEAAKQALETTSAVLAQSKLTKGKAA